LELVNLAGAMERQKFHKGELIITQGEVGDHFFIVLEVSDGE